ncbi:MAG: carbamate kinase [Nitrososphaerota archaeon]|nr:carbamate kinase [Nitrososphaerota archaeon]
MKGGIDRPLQVTIALGGNAIVRPGADGSAVQSARVRATARELVHLIEEGDRILITHGNGPQVGDILVQNEAAKNLVPQMPLDVCGAESQGMIGYMLQQALQGELGAKGIAMPVVTVLTQVLVDSTDPAFRRPTKPVGPFYSLKESSRLSREKGWVMVEDSGRGYRRVVPSPQPREIVESETVAKLFRGGAIVIAAGGGGIPVVRTRGGGLHGVEAVLDKDRTAALLATTMKTKVLLILTDVDGVYLNYPGPRRQKLEVLDVEACERHLREGQFPPGSMGPKIESAVSFLKAGGERVVIASLEEAVEALAGRAGTTITF